MVGIHATMCLEAVMERVDSVVTGEAEGIVGEMISCDRDFYSMTRILRRVWTSLWQGRKPLINLVGNFSYRNNLRLNRKAYADFKSYVKAGV
jgi:hypothetical protein